MAEPWEEDIFTGRWEIFLSMPNRGWVDWHGGPPPFRTGEVDVRLRSGRLILYRGVEGIGGNWLHLGERRDIIAYRPHLAQASSGDFKEAIPF